MTLAGVALVLVTAADLRIGDVLTGDGAVVTHRPTVGLRTPRGKVDLGVSYRGEPPIAKQFNARTVIRVERKED